MKNLSRLALVGLTSALLAGTAGQAFAQDYRYRHEGAGYEHGYRHGGHHGGFGVGAGIAAGVLGGAALGAYAARPAYGYGGYDNGYGNGGYYNNGD